MNLQSKMPATADEFLRWNEGREGKREFVRGRVVELMIHTTKRHAILATRLAAMLMRSLPYPVFSVGSADFAIRTPDGVRYPDVFVDRETAGGNLTDLAASEPVLLAEILSPSSYTRDFGEKLADYTGIPSLLHYLILAQDEPRIWLWSRAMDGTWSGPLLAAGMETTVGLPGLDATLALSELYNGILERNDN